MADLSTLANLFIGQATAPASSSPPSWQGELMKQMDPEAAKTANIRNALAAAAAAIANSKGGLIRGISQGIVGGAQAYNAGQNADQQRRIEAMKTMDDYSQGQEDRRLGLLKDAVTMQGGQQDRVDTRQYRADSLALRREEAAARKSEAAARQGGAGPAGILSSETAGNTSESGKSGGSLNPQRDSAGRLTQKEQNRRAAIRQFYDWKKQMIESRNPPTPEEERAFKLQLLDDYGIRDLYEPAAPKKADETPAPSYPTSAADYLKKNPQFRDQFDAKYGEGAAASVLGQ